MKIESLYGVTHRLEIIQFGAFLKECRVSPSEQLLQELSSLARGTRVGIEFFPESTFEVDGIKIDVSPGSKYYWQQIINVCQARGLEIVCLDDPSTFKKHVAKLLEEESLLRQQEAGQTPSLIHDKRLRALEEAIYKARVEADYLREVEREKQIKKAISREKPAVVIVGEVHGDFFIHGKNSLPQAGISVRSYRKERPFPLAENTGSPPLFDYLWPVPTRIIDNSSPDESSFLARERLIRRYNAVTQGRIIPEKVPDLIGTWDAGCRPRGLFEIYTNGPGFSGLIEDTLGTASFSGKMDGNTIEFQKTYLDRYSLVRNAGTILYQGVFRGNQYQGSWELEETRGDFTLKKFKPQLSTL